MIDPVDPTLFPQVPDAKPTNNTTVEQAFDLQLARWVVKELTATLFDDGSPMSGAGALQTLFQEALADRLVAHGPDGGFLQRPEGPGGFHGPAPSGEDDHFHVTSGFGTRSDPFTGASRTHKGVDVAAPRGTPVGSARAGVVTFAGRNGGYGNLVIVDHGGGMETRYAHLDRIDVQPGAVVEARDALGTVGSTGRSTGPHLHFEVRKGRQAVDPSDLLPGFQAQVLENVRR